MKHLAFFSIFILFISCNNSVPLKTQQNGDETLYPVQQNDDEMNEAILKANQSIEKLNKAFLARDPNCESLAIKVRFKTLVGGEHLWVSIINYENSEYTGVVNNEAAETKEVKLGDTIHIDKNNISDWMYVAQGKLIGGYTLRVLRNRMTAEERKQFDAECGFSFE